jgi:hypothetical protein
MKTCTNISAKTWLKVTTAKAARHSRSVEARMFGLGSSMYRGQTPKINSDEPLVDR